MTRRILFCVDQVRQRWDEMQVLGCGPWLVSDLEPLVTYRFVGPDNTVIQRSVRMTPEESREYDGLCRRIGERVMPSGYPLEEKIS